MSKGKSKLMEGKGLRIDGRKPSDLRPIKLEVGLLDNADGSAYIEQGKNKILVAVYGPREIYPKHLARPDRARIRCRYHMAPFSTDTRKSAAPSRREREISRVIGDALEPAVFVEYYPRTAIDVFIEVLESDGGTRCAGATTSALALADAGIPMRDLVVACAAGKIDGRVVLDLDDHEDKMGEADLPIAIMPNTGEITLAQMDGSLSPDEFEEALKMAIDGCRKINVLQKEVLKQMYTVNTGETATEKKEEN